MRGLPTFRDPNLLVGAEHFSDAGVYRLADDLAIVQSTDFFAPIVDDPYDYGRIAAANSLSDLYAMGATPRTALNIVGFPESLDSDILADILRGGADAVVEAGAVVLGGHSVRAEEIMFGLAVTGTVDPRAMLTNAGAKPGDALILTKPLGTGLITTANKSDRCPPETLRRAIESMTTLNASGAGAAIEFGAHASTDITGFGLAGHALEMAQASGVGITLSLAGLPIIEGAEALAGKENHSRAVGSNREFTLDRLSLDDEGHARTAFLFDPQTSGGLLIAVDADRADDLIARCRESGLHHAARVGEVVEGDARLLVTS